MKGTMHVQSMHQTMHVQFKGKTLLNDNYEREQPLVLLYQARIRRSTTD